MLQKRTSHIQVLEESARNQEQKENSLLEMIHWPGFIAASIWIPSKSDDPWAYDVTCIPKIPTRRSS